MRAVICLLLCAALGCSCTRQFIFKDPPKLGVLDSSRVFVECKICNTTDSYILNIYSAIEEKEFIRCKYFNNGIKECLPNSRTYYNKICDREECYLNRGQECENPLNYSWRGIQCAPGLACDEHSDGKHRCGPEMYRNDKFRRNDDTFKSLPLVLRSPNFFEELAMKFSSNDPV